MHIKYLSISVCAIVCGFLVSHDVQAGSVNDAYKDCTAAIAQELGDGRLRHDLLSSRNKDGSRTQWINVRHRPSGAAETVRLRVQCETTGGAVTELDVAEGAWKKRRMNQAPTPVE